MTLPAVGLILGTRLWYKMWDANEDDDVAFERRAGALLKEIGDRCKVGGSSTTVGTEEARQQAHEPTPAPSPAPTRQVTQARTAAVGARHDNTTSSLAVQQRQNKAQQGSTVTTAQRTPSTYSMASGSFAEMAAFIRDERAQLEVKLEMQRQAWDAKLETQRQAHELQRQAW